MSHTLRLLWFISHKNISKRISCAQEPQVSWLIFYLSQLSSRWPIVCFRLYPLGFIKSLLIWKWVERYAKSSFWFTSGHVQCWLIRCCVQDLINPLNGLYQVHKLPCTRHSGAPKAILKSVSTIHHWSPYSTACSHQSSLCVFIQKYFVGRRAVTVHDCVLASGFLKHGG